MASARAQEIADVLWELKKNGKLGRHTDVAKKAGFAPGSNGRNVLTTLKTVRRDWPHLQWWRIVPDDGVLEKDSELAKALAAGGIELKDYKPKDKEDAKAKDKDKDKDLVRVKIEGLDDLAMSWPDPPPEENAEGAAAPAKS